MSTSETSSTQAQLVGLPEMPPATPAGPALLGGNMNMLDSVKVGLTVVLGEAQTSIGELMHLQQGATLKVDRHVDSPVDLIVNGNIVARGQLVAIDDNFGVRITEIAPTSKN